MGLVEFSSLVACGTAREHSYENRPSPPPSPAGGGGSRRRRRVGADYIFILIAVLPGTVALP
jgi:hypothetical protein